MQHILLGKASFEIHLLRLNHYNVNLNVNQSYQLINSKINNKLYTEDAFANYYGCMDS